MGQGFFTFGRGDKGGMDLKKIKGFIGAAAGAVIGSVGGRIYERIKQERRLDEQEELNKKMHFFYQLLIQWLTIKRDGINLAEYFKYNGYQTIAVYGMRELGEQLISELKGTDIQVKYIVDRNADKLAVNLPKYKPEDNLPQVDALVVTAIYYFQDIQEMMEEKIDCPIISLEDVVYGLR